MPIEFKDWGKTARYYRDIIITEKIDGTNAAIGIMPIEGVNHMRGVDVTKPYSLNDITIIDDNVFAKVLYQGEVYGVYAQSRNRLIRPGKHTDNAGFAGWVAEHAAELVKHLSPGLHYGEWWGSGIGRNYGLSGGDKRFSLFNTHAYRTVEERSEGLLRCVPILYQGPNTGDPVGDCMKYLSEEGSEAQKGFGNPEGVCVYHSASKQITKVTFEYDKTGKWDA